MAKAMYDPRVANASGRKPTFSWSWQLPAWQVVLPLTDLDPHYVFITLLKQKTTSGLI
jgi:hypothetical protein